MKVALLITGQLRTYKLCRNFIKKSIIDMYDTDVFLSIDTNNVLNCNPEHPTHETKTSDVEDAIQFYSPVDHWVCDSYNEVFNCDKKRLRPLSISILPLDRYKLVFEQFYLVKNAYRMLKTHIEKTGVHYDIVIRTRFDTVLYPHDCHISTRYIHTSFPNMLLYNLNMDTKTITDTDLNLQPPTNAEVGVANFFINGQYSCVDEHVWVHSHSNIETMYSYYDTLFDIVNEISVELPGFVNKAYAEIFFHIFLQKNSLQPIRNNFKVYFCREYYTYS